jgi:hypothetical protein
MNGTPALSVATLAHLIMLSMWGGIVATEAVIEIYGFRRRDFAGAASRFHYWIDLLVELPVVLAVLGTGITVACLVDHITRLHLVKIGFAGVAVGTNLFCIAVVLRRDRRQETGASPSHLRTASRVVLVCFAVGLLFAAVAAVLGFSLGFSRVR